MERLIYDGRIEGDFEGFDDEVLFKMQDGSLWVQARYHYWYHYAYSPEARVIRRSDGYHLEVADKSILVAEATSVADSRIDGDFNGWDGETVYSLMNGQVWQQSKYKYRYKYAHCPPALVYRASGGHKMRVAGTVANVRRIR